MLVVSFCFSIPKETQAKRHCYDHIFSSTLPCDLLLATCARASLTSAKAYSLSMTTLCCVLYVVGGQGETLEHNSLRETRFWVQHDPNLKSPLVNLGSAYAAKSATSLAWHEAGMGATGEKGGATSTACVM